MNGLFTVRIIDVDTGKIIFQVEDAQLDENTVVELMAAASNGKGLIIPCKDSVTMVTPAVMEQRVAVTISETAEIQPE